MLNPKGLEGEFIDGWEAYRQEYWANEKLLEARKDKHKAKQLSRNQNWSFSFWPSSWWRRKVESIPVTIPKNSNNIKEKRRKSSSVSSTSRVVLSDDKTSARTSGRRESPGPGKSRSSKGKT